MEPPWLEARVSAETVTVVLIAAVKPANGSRDIRCMGRADDEFLHDFKLLNYRSSPEYALQEKSAKVPKRCSRRTYGHRGLGIGHACDPRPMSDRHWAIENYVS